MKLIRKILKWWKDDREFWRLMRKSNQESDETKAHYARIREQILCGKNCSEPL